MSAKIRIYSVGVWNWSVATPNNLCQTLEFTPLEFETVVLSDVIHRLPIRIYSVGVWNANLNAANDAPVKIRIYSVGVWNQ